MENTQDKNNEQLANGEPVANTIEPLAAGEQIVVNESPPAGDQVKAGAELIKGGAEFGAEGRPRFEGRGRRDGRDRDRNRDRDPADKDYVEKLVKLNRTAKVVKGGRRFSFSALTVIGDRKGNVGFGFGKANDVSEAIRKSVDKARRNMVKLPVKNGSIPHEITGFFKASQVILKPACSGTGIIAGGPVRAIMEAGGVTDVLSKSIGASSQYNVVKATFNGIARMMDAKAIAKNRGKSLNELWG